jgi:hypothetical protein
LRASGNQETTVPRKKTKLDAEAQKKLVTWIDDALVPDYRANFVEKFKIKGFKQTTFNRCVGPSGRFTEQDAREICMAIGRSFEALTGGPPRLEGCNHHCGLFHAINAATCTEPRQPEVRKGATLRLAGRYKAVFRFVGGSDKAYEVELKPCNCGAMLFDYVKDDDPLPQSSKGFALCVGEMLSIYMIGEGLHWTMACHVPRQLHNRAMMGIILDPNHDKARIDANKFLLVKLGTPIANLLTVPKISKMLDNTTSAANGTLVAERA